MVAESEKETFLLVDSRPAKVHQKEFIPGSVSIPWVLWEQKSGLLPADKNTLLVFYCGGHHCDLSHKSAREAMKLGYTKVWVYSAGVPEWKKQNLALWGNEPSGVVEAPKTVAPGALPEQIAPEDFKKALAAGQLAVVDVRSEREFGTGHIPGSILIPDGEFYKDLDGVIKKLPTDKRVVFVCSTGARSAGAFFAVTDEPGKYNNPHGVQYLNKAVNYNPDGTFVIE